MTDQELQLKEEKERRFREMGIPVPLSPITNPTVPARNVDMARKLAEIRNGALKGEFSTIMKKEGGFEGIPVPQRKNPNAPDTTVQKKIDPKAQALEEALLGGGGGYTPTTTHNGRVLEESAPMDATGAAFVAEQRRKLAERMAEKGIYPQAAAQALVPAPAALAGINEEELEKKIIAISTKVAKTVIKKVLMEYAKTGSGVIIEGGNIKKAEIVDEGFVKIDGKLFKLAPVK